VIALVGLAAAACAPSPEVLAPAPLVVGDRNSMTYSMPAQVPVPRADPRRRARGAAGSGTEALVLWGPTRSKAARFSTRRQASEGRSGGQGYVTVIVSRTT